LTSKPFSGPAQCSYRVVRLYKLLINTQKNATRFILYTVFCQNWWNASKITPCKIEYGRPICSIFHS